MTKEETAINKLIKSALNIYANDPHRFSKRPCQTCKSISCILNESWGCVKLREDRK